MTGSSPSIRIDKLFHYLRFVKTRGQGQKLAADGHVRIDGAPLKSPHTPVRCNQVITFALHEQIRVIRMRTIPERRGPAPEARACYDDLSPPKIVAPIDGERASP